MNVTVLFLTAAVCASVWTPVQDHPTLDAGREAVVQVAESISSISQGVRAFQVS